MNLIDYSQYSTFWRCQELWRLKYLEGWAAAPTGQRDDPLAYGTLYHDGMEHWYRDGQIRLSPDLVEEIGPTKRCLDQVMGMLSAYAQTYPSDPWTVERIEAPLQRPLPLEQWSLVAKVDQVFRLDEPMTIDTGDGASATLTPGVWSLEHKTKSPNIDPASWKEQWTTNTQASFQLLALRAHYENVQGLLVNVCERPRQHIPWKLCKGCRKRIEIDLWKPKAAGHWLCPLCGYEMEFTPKAIPEPTFNLFRMVVRRSADRLAHDLQQIEATADMMNGIIADDTGAHFNLDMCNFGWIKCEFRHVHAELRAPEEPTFVQIENPLDYIGVESR